MRSYMDRIGTVYGRSRDGIGIFTDFTRTLTGRIRARYGRDTDPIGTLADPISIHPANADRSEGMAVGPEKLNFDEFLKF